MITSDSLFPLGDKRRRALAVRIGETAGTATVIHSLLNGSCKAFALQEPTGSPTALVEVIGLSGEPSGFGASASRIWELLRKVNGWDCVLVGPEHADELGQLIQDETNRSVRLYGDICMALERPTALYRHPSVRQLAIDDRSLIVNPGSALWPEDFAQAELLLAESIVAAAFSRGQVVCRAHAQSWSGRYAEISVFTEALWRGRGLATAAASLVCARLQERGQIPVWSFGEDNWASSRISEKLGFAGSIERTYVIPG